MIYLKGRNPDLSGLINVIKECLPLLLFSHCKTFKSVIFTMRKQQTTITSHRAFNVASKF